MLVVTSCGADSGAVNHSEASSRTEISKQQMLSNRESQAMTDSTPWGEIQLGQSDPLKILPATRISVETRFNPAVAGALHLTALNERPFANRVSDACVRMLRSTGRPSSIMASPGQIRNDGTNVLLRLTIEPNAKGTPYRISLVAIQGDAHWWASIERPSFRYVPNNIPIRPDGTTPDGRPYWDAARDTDALAERLCNHLVSGGSNAS
ncbi:hypothetical protein AB2M62_11600 [Sphingomonas sp. MMS12-HWE2-04]|uniref:hypothetical protein n=1 Tax=Sphingomonas sp. MMS12-HWE2-04 TaxID=3234199 RepID=UPI00384CEAB8